VLQVELYGELAAILALTQAPNANRAGTTPTRFSLAAGTRNQRCLHLLAGRIPRLARPDTVTEAFRGCS
jgi:hypothetical protein